MTEQPKSWREQIKVHPAADLFPTMTPDEVKALAEDIKKNGLAQPIVLWTPDGNYRKWRHLKRGEFYLLDGRNRVDALVSLDKIDFDEDDGGWPYISCYTLKADAKPIIFGPDVDPYHYVLSANIHRRHLTTEQKRDIIAKVLKAQPSKSNRTIAKQTKVDDKTVGSVRREMEQRAEIPHVSTVEDTKGRKQPAKKPPTKKKRRDVEDYIAEKKARKAADAPVLVPQQIDIEECIAENEKSSAVQLKLDDVALLPFIVRHGGRIVAAFAKHNDADDWARYRSANYGCRCTVSTVKEVLDAFEDGQSVDACTIAAG